jgi:nucleoside-diphosphate-sugar epimerase
MPGSLPFVHVLVIGGTGPTGIPLVQGLVDRGHRVTILHRGTHERAETPDSVEHLHTDPFDELAMREALHGTRFDVTYAMYGRLRVIADVLKGHTGRVISVGGVPAYRGWMNAWLYDPPGLPVPVAEDAPTVAVPEEDEKGYRIVRTEQAVFAAHPDATHFRYPYVYGPYQLTPREWIVVRRVLDRRERIVVADDGLTLHHHGYTENIAHALLLALDAPDAAAGKIFNIADEEVLSVRQVVEIIAGALDHEFEVVSMPYDLAVPARPLLAQPLPTHRVLDLTRVRHDLGYRDVVPAREALARTARWLAANPIRGSAEEFTLTDPFDYATEDQLVDGWLAARATVPTMDYNPEPRYGLAYSGPGGRARSSAELEA